MKHSLWLAGILTLFCTCAAFGHDLPDRGSNNAPEKIGIEEKTGQNIPADLLFRDEHGNPVRWKEFLGKPAILTLVYYTCEHICPLMLGGLSQALPRLNMVLGRDYRMITVSFDETDTPEQARELKKNYIKAAEAGIPEDGWIFLTGNRENISRLIQAVGFRFEKEIHGFNHPVVLIFLSPEGKISKYFPVTNYQYGAQYPIVFSSFDLNVALTEAAQGRAVTGVRKAVLYCFSHEPPGQSRFFTFIAGMGAVTLAAMAAFFIYLLRSTRRYRKGEDDDVEK